MYRNPKASLSITVNAIVWRLGRDVLLMVSAFGAGFLPLAAADDAKLADTMPPIFTQSAPRKADATQTPKASAASDSNAGPNSKMLRLISDELPKFNARLSDQDSKQIDNLLGPDQTDPVLMEPFTVLDARARELVRPHKTLLEKVNGIEPVFRHVGKGLTSELSFVGLATAYNWKPFSIGPPPVFTLRLTISW